LTSFSTHPLSSLVHKSIRACGKKEVKNYKEVPGKGIEGTIDGNRLMLGSAVFVGEHINIEDSSSKVFLKLNEKIVGYYTITTSIRPGLKEMLLRLRGKCKALVSGDNPSDSGRMRELFGTDPELFFNQTPYDKLAYVKQLQQKGQKVLMVGDGLNDSGALKQSDVGIAVTDDTGIFTPACDGILQGEKTRSLDKFLELAKSSAIILKTGFAISFLYNAIALSFAVTGHLTPLVAAILMPISSISVVSYTSFAVSYIAKRKKL
jgi:Cu+-exporting ATPase